MNYTNTPEALTTILATALLAATFSACDVGDRDEASTLNSTNQYCPPDRDYCLDKSTAEYLECRIVDGLEYCDGVFGDIVCYADYYHGTAFGEEDYSECRPISPCGDQVWLADIASDQRESGDEMRRQLRDDIGQPGLINATMAVFVDPLFSCFEVSMFKTYIEDLGPQPPVPTWASSHYTCKNPNGSFSTASGPGFATLDSGSLTKKTSGSRFAFAECEAGATEIHVHAYVHDLMEDKWQFRQTAFDAKTGEPLLGPLGILELVE